MIHNSVKHHTKLRHYIDIKFVPTIEPKYNLWTTKHKNQHIDIKLVWKQLQRKPKTLTMPWTTSCSSSSQPHISSSTSLPSSTQAPGLFLVRILSQNLSQISSKTLSSSHTHCSHFQSSSGNHCQSSSRDSRFWQKTCPIHHPIWKVRNFAHSCSNTDISRIFS